VNERQRIEILNGAGRKARITGKEIWSGSIGRIAKPIMVWDLRSHKGIVCLLVGMNRIIKLLASSNF
jgi:hypothetical protein